MSIEQILLSKLKADLALVSLVSTVCGGTEPSIFTNFAPESTNYPYIVFEVGVYDSNFAGIHSFDINFYVYDNSSSASNITNIAKRIEFIFDRKSFDGGSYRNVRFFFNSTTKYTEEDPRVPRVCVQFYARGCRYDWAIQL